MCWMLCRCERIHSECMLKASAAKAAVKKKPAAAKGKGKGKGNGKGKANGKAKIKVRACCAIALGVSSGEYRQFICASPAIFKTQPHIRRASPRRL